MKKQWASSVKINVNYLRLAILAACCLLVLAEAISFSLGLALFLLIDFLLFVIMSHKEKQDLDGVEIDEGIFTKSELEHLKKIDLSAIAATPEKKGFSAEGNIIGTFVDAPIHEILRDVTNDEVYHYVGVLTHTDVEPVLQKLMLSNKFEKVVRLESGLIYAKKET